MLTGYDIVMAPLCVLLLWVFFSARLRKYNNGTKRLFRNAFKFKLFCCLAFVLVTAFYYKGGDSEMFYYALKDMKQANAAGDLSLWELLFTEHVEDYSPLAYHFEQDNSKYPVLGFMRSSSNFLVPKLAFIPSYLFFNSYLSICLVFAAFSLWGATRLYKMFLHYFPSMSREVALATLFLPSACYWSSGFLKDSICFGAIGFLLYGLLNLFILRKKVIGSLFWIALSIYFLYTIKVYILLAMIPGIGFWLIGHISANVRNISLKRALTFLSIIVAAIAAMGLVNYLTSDVALSKFSIDNILETSSFTRGVYERGGVRGEGAYFQITTTNPVLLGINGLVATFFRPFPWEISSAIVMFSALEALIFFVLLLNLFFRKGFLSPSKVIFGKPVLILCVSFAFIFAISIGISATNFGSLSRYKIPCLPFYLMFILPVYRLTTLPYPGWMEKILSIISKNK